MADDQSRRTDAIQAAYYEQHAEFMKSYLVIAELLTHLTPEELDEYNRIGEEIDAYNVEQETQQRELFALGAAVSTADQKFEYVGRLLAVTEKNTERLRSLSERLSKVVRSHLAKPE